MISLQRFFNLGIPTAFTLVAMLQSPQTAAALVPQQGSVQTVDGQNLTGSVQSIDGSGFVRGTGLPDSLELQSVVKFETGNRVDSVAYPIMVTFARQSSGDGIENRSTADRRIGVETALLSKEKISLRSRVGKFRLPIQAIRAIVWSTSTAVEKAIATPSRDEDRVIVQVGDRQQTVAGIVEAIDDESVAIHYKNKLRTIGLEKVKAVVLADVGLKPPAGVLAKIQTTDGNAWYGAINSMLASENEPNSVFLDLQVSSSASIKIGLTNIVVVNIESDRLAMLSDLQPIDVRESTDFVVARTFQKNRSIVGGPLRIMGVDGKVAEFKNGLGTQATCRLDFKNDKEFTRFAATVGIDLGTEGRGDCRVIVRADGVEKWNQRVVAGEPAKSIDVDIDGSDRVSLIVLPGRDFDLADHVNWCRARFIKTK
jgi:hypothetical protein